MDGTTPRSSPSTSRKRPRENETESQRIKREKAAERQRRKRERDRALAQSHAPLQVQQSQAQAQGQVQLEPQAQTQQQQQGYAHPSAPVVVNAAGMGMLYAPPDQGAIHLHHHPMPQLVHPQPMQMPANVNEYRQEQSQPPPQQPETVPSTQPQQPQLTKEEEARRDKVRAAARERQRKHRALVRQRKMREMGMEMEGEQANGAQPDAMRYPAPAEYVQQPDLQQAHQIAISAESQFPALAQGLGGQTFASTLLLSLSCAPLLKAHIMRSLNMTNEELASLEPVITEAWERWNAQVSSIAHTSALTDVRPSECNTTTPTDQLQHNQHHPAASLHLLSQPSRLLNSKLSKHTPKYRHRHRRKLKPNSHNSNSHNQRHSKPSPSSNTLLCRVSRSHRFPGQIRRFHTLRRQRSPTPMDQTLVRSTFGIGSHIRSRGRCRRSRLGMLRPGRTGPVRLPLTPLTHT